MDTAPSQGQQFDLRDIAQRIWAGWLKRQAITNGIFAGLCAVFAAVFAGTTVQKWWNGEPFGYVEAGIVLTGLPVGFLILTCWVWNCRARYPAIGVTVGSEVLEIQYIRDRSSLLRWDSPSFRLRIRENYHPSVGRNLRSSRFFWRPRLLMTDEAANAITEMARSRGLTIREVSDSYSKTGRAIEIVRR
jgi:hypothetical protein